jgi:hypothetical protein
MSRPSTWSIFLISPVETRERDRIGTVFKVNEVQRQRVELAAP